MDKKINGLQVTDILYEELRTYLLKKDKKVNVVDISIGDDFGGKMYSKMKQKRITSKTGIGFRSTHFDRITEEYLKMYLNFLNDDKEVTGIMLQLPLPDYLKEQEREILDCIDPKKDIYVITSISIC